MDDTELDRRSTAEVVAAALRDRILAGEIPPGTSIRDSELAPQVGVSRTTMREALQELVHEGLLTYTMHRGTVVTALTGADVTDIYAVRRLLELAAIGAAGEHSSNLVPLERCIQRGIVAAKEADIADFVEIDMRFHSELVQLGRSARLVSYHAAAIGQLRLALNMLDRSKRDLQAQAGEHQRIWRNLQRRQFKEASELLRQHLDQAQQRLLVFLGGHRTADVD